MQITVNVSDIQSALPFVTNEVSLQLIWRLRRVRWTDFYIFFILFFQVV